MKTCPKCNTEHTKQGTFCSRSCANSRSHSAETRAKISNSVKANPSGFVLDQTKRSVRRKDPSKHTTSTCKGCNKEFSHRKLDVGTFCSNKCRFDNQGGYQPNSTRKSSSIYKGYRMDSKAERNFAELLDEHNISWVKNTTQKFEYKPNKFYYPDFYLPRYNAWIEIKGAFYLREEDELRWRSVPNHEVIWSSNITLPSCVGGL